MDIQFKKGTVEYLSDCTKAMENPAMCTYFQSEESRKNAVMEGINNDESA